MLAFCVGHVYCNVWSINVISGMILGTNLHFPRKMLPFLKKTFSAAIFACVVATSLTAGSSFAAADPSMPDRTKQLQMLAEQGDAQAQYELGNIYQSGQSVEQSSVEAAKWYQKAAEQGYAKAQNNLALCYTHGQGVRQSYTKAAKWYRKAAEQGFAIAQYNLGVCYEKGEGVRQSYTKAKEYYGLACDNGDDDGCERYARLNKKGY